MIFAIIGLRFTITKVILINICFQMIVIYCYLGQSVRILYSLWSMSNACSLFFDTYTFCVSVQCVLPLYCCNKVSKPQPNIVEDRVALRGERAHTVYLAHGNSKNETRGRSRHENNS